MGYTNITLGLTLVVPTTGTRNWGQQLLTSTWNKISEHDHTGGGKGNQITSAAIQPNFGLTQANQTTSGPAITIDFNNGNNHYIDWSGASGAVTITLSNPVAGAVYHLFFKNPATALSVTWPASVKWPQGQAPIWTETLNAIDGVTLYWNASASVYYADWQLNYS